MVIATTIIWAIGSNVFFVVFGLIGKPLTGLISYIPFVWSFLLMVVVLRKLSGKKPISIWFKLFILVFLSVPTGVMLLFVQNEIEQDANNDTMHYSEDEEYSKN